MTERKYDFIVFGATGFTGQFVVEETYRICQNTLSEDKNSLSFAIAGRSQSKLESVLQTATANTTFDFSNIEIIIADVNDKDSLISMVKQGKVVINCVGPYRFHGMKVVEACIAGGADMVDISGEPQYLENVQLACTEDAQRENVYIVGSCGFDSIPVDMGVEFIRRNFSGHLNGIEAIVGLADDSEGSASGNVTTLECALHGFSARGELGCIRAQLFHNKRLQRSSHKLPNRGLLWWGSEAQRWCLPNVSSDRSVVTRSMHLQQKRQDKDDVVPHVNVFFGLQSLWTVVGAVVLGAIFSMMAPFQWTRQLMIKHPRFFTFGAFARGGADRSALKKLRFCVTLVASGWKEDKDTDKPPDTTAIATVTGPDPGYTATAIMVCQCALTLVRERTRLPPPGVYTPASIFGDTTLIQGLGEKGVRFQMKN